ncbi:MAG TPA: hypothetical protein VHC63_16275 [Acidimicrobiales bacterium]|nr:hypothetical protein [Acidimicrobiales bacterium]
MADELHDDPDPRVLWGWIIKAVRPYVGWILIAIGAILMSAGYLGVSREALPAKQIPYLVSGGIGGIFFAVIGAYFLGTQEMRNDSGRLDRLEHMVEELHAALLSRPDAPARTNGSRPAVSDEVEAPARKVVVVPGGQLFHRVDCTVAQGKKATELTPAAARKRGMRPCPTCVPAT